MNKISMINEVSRQYIFDIYIFIHELFIVFTLISLSWTHHVTGKITINIISGDSLQDINEVPGVILSPRRISFDAVQGDSGINWLALVDAFLPLALFWFCYLIAVSDY